MNDSREVLDNQLSRFIEKTDLDCSLIMRNLKDITPVWYLGSTYWCFLPEFIHRGQSKHKDRTEDINLYYPNSVYRISKAVGLEVGYHIGALRTLYKEDEFIFDEASFAPMVLILKCRRCMNYFPE